MRRQGACIEQGAKVVKSLGDWRNIADGKTAGGGAGELL